MDKASVCWSVLRSNACISVTLRRIELRPSVLFRCDSGHHTEVNAEDIDRDAIRCSVVSLSTMSINFDLYESIWCNCEPNRNESLCF